MRFIANLHPDHIGTLDPKAVRRAIRAAATAYEQAGPASLQITLRYEYTEPQPANPMIRWAGNHGWHFELTAFVLASVADAGLDVTQLSLGMPRPTARSSDG